MRAGGREVTLYLFALDGFKEYNDAYGDDDTGTGRSPAGKGHTHQLEE